MAPVVAAPWAIAPGDRFRGETVVRLAAHDPRAQIRWTDKPHRDPRDGTPYTGPLYLERTTELRFVALVDDVAGPVVTARFDAIEHGWQVTTATPPNPQYTAGGPDAAHRASRAAPFCCHGF